MYVTIYQYDSGVITQILTVDDRDICRLIMADEQTRPVLLKITSTQKRAEYVSILTSLKNVREQTSRLFAVSTDRPVFNRVIEEHLHTLIDENHFS